MAIHHYLRCTPSAFDVLHTNDKDSLLRRDCNLEETRRKKRDINPDSHYIAQSFGQSTVVETTSSFFFFPYIVSSICKREENHRCNSLHLHLYLCTSL